MKLLFHLIHRMPHILQFSKKKDVPIFVFFTNKEQVGINRHAGDDHW